MKAIFFYVFLGAVAVNIAGNLAVNTTESHHQLQQARFEKLCVVNAFYC